MKPCLSRDIARASFDLSQFVEARAGGAAARLGFGWRPDPAAPDTFERLLVSHQHSLSTRDDLPVATVNASPTIFTNASVTYAMRFWHDTTHVALSCDFGFNGEMRVASHHLTDLADAGFDPDSLAWRILRADTVGQNLVFTMTDGGFVADQRAFAIEAICVDLPTAVLHAVADITNRPTSRKDVQQLEALIRRAGQCAQSR